MKAFLQYLQVVAFVSKVHSPPADESAFCFHKQYTTLVIGDRLHRQIRGDLKRVGVSSRLTKAGVEITERSDHRAIIST